MAKKQAAAQVRKTDALSIRIDPRLKYGLDLASRVQRRPVTSVVEWAIAEALANERVRDKNGHEWTLKDASGVIWSDNELERLLALWFNFPDLLDYEESRQVNVLLRTHELWKDGSPNRYLDFEWSRTLPVWDKLKPVLIEAAGRAPVVGLTNEDLDDAGLADLVLPF